MTYTPGCFVALLPGQGGARLLPASPLPPNRATPKNRPKPDTTPTLPEFSSLSLLKLLLRWVNF